MHRPRSNRHRSPRHPPDQACRRAPVSGDLLSRWLPRMGNAAVQDCRLPGSHRRPRMSGGAFIYSHPVCPTNRPQESKGLSAFSTTFIPGTKMCPQNAREEIERRLHHSDEFRGTTIRERFCTCQPAGMGGEVSGNHRGGARQLEIRHPFGIWRPVECTDRKAFRFRRTPFPRRPDRVTRANERCRPG